MNNFINILAKGKGMLLILLLLLSMLTGCGIAGKTTTEERVNWYLELQTPEEKARNTTEEQSFFSSVSSGIEAHSGIISIALLAVIVVLLIIIAVRQKK